LVACSELQTVNISAAAAADDDDNEDALTQAYRNKFIL